MPTCFCVSCTWLLSFDYDAWINLVQTNAYLAVFWHTPGFKEREPCAAPSSQWRESWFLHPDSSPLLEDSTCMFVMVSLENHLRHSVYLYLVGKSPKYPTLFMFMCIWLKNHKRHLHSKLRSREIWILAQFFFGGGAGGGYFCVCVV